jgi:UDP-N-acetylglucosamine--N-acetylmuramyl-(pentapeptide) pyrophosphoryl-undecaprenol N-acetylglucosamine transferase
MLRAPLMLFRAVFQAASIIRRINPSVAFGMGGFVSGPGGVTAWLLRVPLLVHEQNAIAGLTNRLLARLATSVFEAFPGSFPASRRAVEVGNPVRTEIVDLEAPEARFRGRTGPLRLLVFGGSQGARVLNRVVPSAVAEVPESRRPLIRHQSGDSMLAETREAYAALAVNAEVEPFIGDMAAAYAWADLVLCRSGALTVAELAAAGVASILVPFALAVDDHQTANGQVLVSAGAARLINERRFDAGTLAGLLTELSEDRARLAAMAHAAREVARTDAAARLADEGLRYVS